MKTFVRLEDGKVLAGEGKEVLPIDTDTAVALCKIGLIIDCYGMPLRDKTTLRWPNDSRAGDNYRYLFCGHAAVTDGIGHDSSTSYAEEVAMISGVPIINWKDILFSLEELQDDG